MMTGNNCEGEVRDSYFGTFFITSSDWHNLLEKLRYFLTRAEGLWRVRRSVSSATQLVSLACERDDGLPGIGRGE
jgi:hypothetical protein